MPILEIPSGWHSVDALANTAQWDLLAGLFLDAFPGICSCQHRRTASFAASFYARRRGRRVGRSRIVVDYLKGLAEALLYPGRNFSPSRRLAMTKWRGET